MIIHLGPELLRGSSSQPVHPPFRESGRATPVDAPIWPCSA